MNAEWSTEAFMVRQRKFWDGRKKKVHVEKKRGNNTHIDRFTFYISFFFNIRIFIVIMFLPPTKPTSLTFQSSQWWEILFSHSTNEMKNKIEFHHTFLFFFLLLVLNNFIYIEFDDVYTRNHWDNRSSRRLWQHETIQIQQRKVIQC